jgi:hypothetical protein
LRRSCRTSGGVQRPTTEQQRRLDRPQAVYKKPILSVASVAEYASHYEIKSYVENVVGRMCRRSSQFVADKFRLAQRSGARMRNSLRTRPCHARSASGPDQRRAVGPRSRKRPDPVISFLVDQNFDEHIVDGLTRRDATLEFTHVRDVGLATAPDPAPGRPAIVVAIAGPPKHRGFAFDRSTGRSSSRLGRCGFRLVGGRRGGNHAADVASDTGGDHVYDSVDANRGAAVPVHQVHPQPVLVDPVVAPDRQLKRPCTAVIPGGQVSRISRKEVEAELWVWSISRSSNSMTGLPETRETWRAHNVQTSQSLLAGGRQPTAIP